MGKAEPNTIEAIEKKCWLEPEFPSSLVLKCHALRKKDLDLFEIEDYRILIGQNLALEILIPRALDILKQNFLAEGDFYEGDLLKAVLTSDKTYWNVHPLLKQEIISLFDQNKDALKNLFVENDIKKAFESFTL